jgi:hypothetical protein
VRFDCDSVFASREGRRTGGEGDQHKKRGKKEERRRKKKTEKKISSRIANFFLRNFRLALFFGFDFF